MALNAIQPFIHVEDSNGSPIVGAVLKIYEAGTTTYRPIFSDSGLTNPITNPLSGTNASDASGNFVPVFMAAGVYKLRAETSVGVLIWEYDNLDTGTSAGAGALPITSGGTGATTASAARANLGAASTSDVTALAEQISAFSASLQSLQSTPQGRLTPTAGTPVISAGVTAGTAVYYSPYGGNLCPVFDGVQFNPEIFAELTLTLTASYILNSHYDCFIIKDAGTVRLVTGPAWSTITAGGGARGSGAGTTELTRLNGLLVNANAMATARNGASTYSVDAYKGTYVGSIYIDGVAGQISCLSAFGQSRKWGVWNAYNRMPVLLKAGDPNASWAYLTNTIRAARADATNCITVFQGLAEEQYDLQTTALVSGATVNNAQTIAGQIGIGYNSTTAYSGQTGKTQLANNSGGTLNNVSDPLRARYIAPPALGVNVITALESGLGADVATWNGTEAFMVLSAGWRA